MKISRTKTVGLIWIGIGALSIWAFPDPYIYCIAALLIFVGIVALFGGK